MTETVFEHCNRLAAEAKAAARSRGGIDWSCYEPLADRESLEARDSVEHEVWGSIENQARRHRGMNERPEPVTMLDLLREVLEELRAEDARRRRLARPLREVLAARGMTLSYVDTGSGHFIAVETPLLTAGVG